MSCGTRTQNSARAILMALGSSVLPSGSITYQTGTANCCYCFSYWWPLSAPLRQPAPSPILHPLWLRTPLPNLPVRAPAADAFTEVLLTDITAGTANCTYYGHCRCGNCGTACGGP
ncbi:hypothetical protein GCM10017778_46070 [Streptomyces vinaceus]|nr:hypothetical protein GCM10017778_46070 [Streptomyces vinaceus]